MSERVSLSKLCPYCKPKQFFKSLKLAENNFKTVYIYGSAGCGKTTGVRNYLKKKAVLWLCGDYKSGALDKMPAISSIRQGTVVIDDLACIRDDSSKEYIKSLIEENFWVLLISRSSLPGWLYDSYIENRFLIIDKKEILLTRDETAKLMSYYSENITEEKVDLVYKIMGGYPFAGELYNHLEINKINFSDDSSWLEKPRKIFFEYLNYRFCKFLEHREQWFLMLISSFPSFTQELVQEITGMSNVHFLINSVIEKEDILHKQGDIYTLENPFREFFVWKFEREAATAEKNKLYSHVGEYYEKNNHLLDAVSWFQKAKNNEGISRVLIKNFNSHPGWGKYMELKKYYLALPEEDIRKSTVLMSGMSMIQSMLLNVDESEKWYTELKVYATEMKRGSKQRKEAEGRLAYLDIALPHRGIKNMAKILINTGVLLKNNSYTLPEISVTSNLPSIMNGGKDFSEWSKKDTELANTMGKVIAYVLGKFGVGLIDTALGESRFEKGCDIQEVLTLLNNGRYAAEINGKIELCFASVGLMVRAYCLKGELSLAKKLLDSFTEKVKAENAVNLLPNINALQCRLALYEGNISFIQDWLANAPNEEIEFSCMDRYIYITKARVLIFFAKYEEAFKILHRIEYYARVSERYYLIMESKMLSAICRFRQNDEGWKSDFKELVPLLEEFKFVRLVCEEGGAILPLFNKWELPSTPYWKQVLKETKEISAKYPKYLKNVSLDTKLSESEFRVLRLLAEGLTAVSIAEALHISAATVRFHCKNIYRKLDAAGKTDAVAKAKQLNII